VFTIYFFPQYFAYCCVQKQPVRTGVPAICEKLAKDFKNTIHPVLCFSTHKLNKNLRGKILQFHTSPQGGHSGRDATFKRLKQLFFWKGMTKPVQGYIRNDAIC